MSIKTDEVGEWEKHFSAWERFIVVYIGSAAMWIIGKRLQKRHGLKPGKYNHNTQAHN